jgi:hypothetical protein
VCIDGIPASSITVGRGCLDTVAMAHAAGTPAICWQSMAQATLAALTLVSSLLGCEDGPA